MRFRKRQALKREDLLFMGTTARYTKEDIKRIVEEENIRFIRLQFTDIFGACKNVAITKSQ